MKAVVYNGPYDVSVETVTDPKIEEPNDAVIRITTANICGSDLHPYEGRAELDPGMVIGHENMGVVEEVGQGVNRVQVGDRVSIPFNLACGSCRNCDDGFTASCLRANPSGTAGAGYGYPMMGPYWGGQAELLRVPPVGLLAAHSAFLRGAAQVFVVDKEPDRLHLAEEFGATAVDFSDADPGDVIKDATDGFGVDCGVEAVGYR